MSGITPFGMFHTVIALIAVVAGLTALAKYREIGLATAAGRVYVLLTIATCVTGLFIFRHGTFGVPHAIARCSAGCRSGSAGVARGRRARVPGAPDRRGTAGAEHPA